MEAAVEERHHEQKHQIVLVNDHHARVAIVVITIWLNIPNSITTS